MYQLLLSDFIKLEFSRHIFVKILKHQTSLKFVQWESSCCCVLTDRQTDKQTDRQAEANSRFFAILANMVSVPKLFTHM
jgi:hypothetical protein